MSNLLENRGQVVNRPNHVNLPTGFNKIPVELLLNLAQTSLRRLHLKSYELAIDAAQDVRTPFSIPWAWGTEALGFRVIGPYTLYFPPHDVVRLKSRETMVLNLFFA